MMCSPCNSALPFMVMVMIECGEVLNITLNKAVMNNGMNNLVLTVYYNALGTIVLLPLFIVHRHRSNLPPLSFSLQCKFFFLGLLLCFLQIFGITGIKYSSPTLASAMGNLIPAFIFLLAVVFRMETFDFRRSSSRAKSVGTVTAVSGALVMTLYQGPTILMTSSKLFHELLRSQQSHWVLGGFLLVITCVFSSSWTVAQTAIAKEYPDETTIAFFSCLFGTIQCSVYSLLMERNPRAWKLRTESEIIAVVYSAIFVSVVRNTSMTWCLRKKGPVYVAMFKPLQMVIALFVGFMLLSDALYLGSVIGGTIITAGFYAVMWGATKEKEIVAMTGSSSKSTPLLDGNPEK